MGDDPMTERNDNPSTATRATNHSTSKRTSARIAWVGRRLRRKFRWVLIGLAVVYLMGAFGALRDCKHELDHHTPQAVDSE
jgi:hypothetical protein